MTDSCRKVELGRHGSIPEIKVTWNGIVPTTHCRTSSLVVYAEFCAPNDLLDSAWNDIVSCAIGAGVGAGIAALVATPASALPTFLAIFSPCIANKLEGRANELHVSLSMNQEANSDWHGC